MRIVVAAALAAVMAAVPCVRGARVLAVETIAGKSHWNFMSAVLRALTDNGHAVTAFTSFPDGDRENHTEIDTSAAFPANRDMSLARLKTILNGPFALLRLMLTVGRHGCELLHNDRRLRDALTGHSARGRFDAIVIEPGMSGCVTYVAAESDLPLIFAVPTPTVFSTDRATFGHFPNPAAVSSLLADHAVPETTGHRFYNAAVYLYANVVVAFQEFLLKTRDPRPYDTDALVSPSVVFINGHFIGDASKPIPSNAVNVGGIHLRPAAAIPNDILEFIEDSPHGIILFTFGSIVATSLLPKNIQKTFLDALAVLPQGVLLKYECELENKPSDVMSRKWLPQRDILLYPKVKLFVGHGGISGMYEAVDAGVPVLAFPLFGDQPRNVDHLVEAGVAIAMDVYSVTKDGFLKNIAELVNNRSYKENAMIASDVFKDRPMSPEKSVAYWSEYVIRHKGTPHLKSQALNITWYQYVLLDLFGFMLISVFVVLLIIFKIREHFFVYAC